MRSVGAGWRFPDFEGSSWATGAADAKVLGSLVIVKRTEEGSYMALKG